MKEGELKITGKMDEKDKDDLRKEVIDELDKEAKEIMEKAIELELPKDEEDLGIIENVNNWLADYLKGSDAEEFIQKVSEDKFIVLSDGDFNKIGADLFNDDWSQGYGKMIPGVDIIFVRKLSETEKFKKILALLHELIHFNSKYKLRVGGQIKDSVDYPGGSRSGYSIKSIKEEGGEFKSYRYFDGFNEAIVQTMALDMLRRHAKELEAEFGINEEDQKKFLDGYAGYEYVFMVMLKKLSGELGISPKDYWQKIKTGLFTGNLMFLRDIERVFGKGSLRVLAFMGSSSAHAQDEDLIRLFGNFFLADNPDERNEIAEKIFDKEGDERYFDKYKKRRD